ncbi:MAG: hypothetical protein ACXVHL_35885 [Solirubrobacteraceae bacterium]
MALMQVRKSDKSGQEIQPDTGARLRLEYYDGSVARRADLTDAEAAELVKRYGLKEVETRPQRRGERRIRLKP